MGPVIFVEEMFRSLWRRKYLAWSMEGTGTITGALLQLLQQVKSESDCDSVSYVT
jgi:hypothetical protein